MNQDRDLVEEERQAARLAARADDRTRPSQGGGGGGGMDAGTKKLAIVAGGLGGLLVLMVGGWSLLGHRPSGVPILSPPPGPVRVKPLDPGGMQLMGAQVAQTNDSGAEALAPGPEEAAPQALQAEVDRARQADRPAVASAPAAKPPAATASATTASAAPAAAAPVAPVAVAAGAAAALSDAPASVAATAGPVRSAPAATTPVPVRPAPVASAPAPEAVPDRTPAEAPASEATPPAPTGHHSVQLAALDSDAAARTEWSRLVRRAPALFAGHTPVIASISRDNKQFFRLRTGGFASVAEATAFCARAKAAGIACTLADF